MYGEADADGFYQGQIGRRYGLVPSNMVLEIAKDDVNQQSRRDRVDYFEPSRTLDRNLDRNMDPEARRSRWGSTKSKSYDYPDRRPLPGGGYPSDNFSSLDRRDKGRYADYYDGYAGPSTIRPGGYTKGYPRERDLRGGYERSASYEPRGVRDQAYGRKDTLPKRSLRDYSERREPREGGATIQRGERYDYSSERPPVGYPQKPPMDYQDKYDRDYQGPMADKPKTSTAYMPQRDGYGSQGESRPRGQYQQGPPQLQQQQSYGTPQTQQPPQLQQQQMQYQDMQEESQEIKSLKESLRNADMLPMQKMVAKYDYSKTISPNVDAEFELTFREGDIITLYGDVDGDGFYIGELNGNRGLVPSNFVQPMGPSLGVSNLPQQQQQPTSGIMAGPVGAYGPPITQQDLQQRPKGVAFQDTTAKKPAPVRQTSQTSTKTGNSVGGTAVMSNSTAKPKGSGPTTGTVNKAGVKKSDSGRATGTNGNVRKQSQGVKKDAVKVRTTSYREYLICILTITF